VELAAFTRIYTRSERLEHNKLLQSSGIQGRHFRFFPGEGHNFDRLPRGGQNMKKTILWAKTQKNHYFSKTEWGGQMPPPMPPQMTSLVASKRLSKRLLI